MAFFQEPERQPFLRVPAVTAGLILALIVAHLVRVLAPAQQSDAIIANYAFYPARYSHAFLAGHGVNPGSLWDRAVPFVSYIFLHANFTHLAINCVWLLPFGSIVARRFGALFFLAFFLVCGVAGAVAHLATNWGSPQYTIGASAAVSGLMAAGFRIVALIEARDIKGFSAAVLQKPLAPIFSSRILIWSAVWIVLNVIAGLTGLGAGPGAGLIAWQAHIGGYLTGLVLAGPFDFAERRLRA
jgi:membrane associated rhomboid family serine protease